MSNRISLEQALKAYQVMHAPAKFSWKQHYAQETFSSPDMLSCSAEEQEQFKKRLKECNITLCRGIKSTSGSQGTLEDILKTLTDPVNKNIKKIDRSVVYGTSNGIRPAGHEAYNLWNGWQVIDMDLKDANMAKNLHIAFIVILALAIVLSCINGILLSHMILMLITGIIIPVCFIYAAIKKSYS